MSDQALSTRVLNRTTLDRQLLLQRTAMSAEDAIEWLVGLQAQVPNNPYVTLWSRLEGFTTEELATRMTERRAVRMTLMRGTIHTVTARDALGLDPLLRIVITRMFSSQQFNRNIADVPRDEVIAVGSKLVEQEPRTRAELIPLLSKHWPDADAESLAYAVTSLVSLVQVTPRGVWGQAGKAAWTTLASWLHGHDAPAYTLDDVVLRYLAAYGPASVKDIQSWSGLTKLREVTARLGDRLRTYRSEAGAELFDLADATLTDPDAPAPVRFLGEYDNGLLGYADRSRVLYPGQYVQLFAGTNGFLGTILVDGFASASYAIRREHGGANLLLQPGRRFTKAERSDVEAEGQRLMAFVIPEVSAYDVEWAQAR
jgi:hypothetical protein